MTAPLTPDHVETLAAQAGVALTGPAAQAVASAIGPVITAFAANENALPFATEPADWLSLTRSMEDL